MSQILVLLSDATRYQILRLNALSAEALPQIPLRNLQCSPKPRPYSCMYIRSIYFEKRGRGERKGYKKGGKGRERVESTEFPDLFLLYPFHCIQGK